ncbi:MAG TPA: hypothetical protein VNI77_03070 [Nitrososphaera sp.]|nr:hypothetical protein [Nitrososphaera sp.]
MLVASKDEIVYDRNNTRERHESIATGRNNIYNEGSQGTTNFLQTIDYASYLYGSTNVSTYDVRIFTDEYTLVEAFLSPLTNAQFNVTDDVVWREETISANTRTGANSNLQTGAIPAATLVIAIA